MSKYAPNKFFAPIVIAGITLGFFVAAYKFVFAQAEKPPTQTDKSKSIHPKEDRPAS